MVALKPELVAGDRIAMAMTNPKHLSATKAGGVGTALADLGNKIGAEGAVKAGSFEDAMLQAMDSMNNDQLESSTLLQTMVTDPDAVDAHDVTIAMAKANMSLNIAKTVLNRLVTGWKEVINTR